MMSSLSGSDSPLPPSKRLNSSWRLFCISSMSPRMSFFRWDMISLFEACTFLLWGRECIDWEGPIDKADLLLLGDSGFLHLLLSMLRQRQSLRVSFFLGVFIFRFPVGDTFLWRLGRERSTSFSLSFFYLGLLNDTSTLKDSSTSSDSFWDEIALEHFKLSSSSCLLMKSATFFALVYLSAGASKSPSYSSFTMFIFMAGMLVVSSFEEFVPLRLVSPTFLGFFCSYSGLFRIRGLLPAFLRTGGLCSPGWLSWRVILTNEVVEELRSSLTETFLLFFFLPPSDSSVFMFLGGGGIS